jgi:DNA-binding CsgD family transcriptional regulator
MANLVMRAVLRLQSKPSLLAPRERQVFELVGEGATDCQIAAQVGIKEGTVRRTIARIKEKLDLDSRSDLVREAALSSAKRQ